MSDTSAAQMKKILLIEIVEDEDSMLAVLSDKFDEDGFQVLKARNGEEGLQIAFAEHPNLVILDLLMPKMDGFEMFNRLRKDAWGKNVPVIILTNLSEEERIGESLQFDNYEYMLKSDLNLSEIVERVERKLASLKNN